MNHEEMTKNSLVLVGGIRECRSAFFYLFFLGEASIAQNHVSITRKSFPNVTLNRLCCDLPLESSGSNPWLELNTDVKRRTRVSLGKCSAICVVSKHLIEKRVETLCINQLTPNLPTVFEAH